MRGMRIGEDHFKKDPGVSGRGRWACGTGLGPYLFLRLKQALELRGRCVGGLAGKGRRQVEFGVC